MKRFILALILVLPLLVVAQGTPKVVSSSPVYQLSGNPNLVPGFQVQTGRYAIAFARDTTTGIWYDFDKDAPLGFRWKRFSPGTIQGVIDNQRGDDDFMDINYYNNIHTVSDDYYAVANPGVINFNAAEFLRLTSGDSLWVESNIQLDINSPKVAINGVVHPQDTPAGGGLPPGTYIHAVSGSGELAGSNGYLPISDLGVNLDSLSIGVVQDSIVVLYNAGLEISRDTVRTGGGTANTWNMPIDYNEYSATSKMVYLTINSVITPTLANPSATALNHGDIQAFYNASSTGIIKIAAPSGYNVAGTDTLQVLAGQAVWLQVDSINTEFNVISRNSTGGGAIVAEAFSPSINLSASSYYLNHNQIDTIRFSISDSTIGNWKTARIASTGQYPLYFDGVGWDASGFFNIVDGGILPIGNHTMYFESTPYGVMVSVPSNYNPSSPGAGEFSPLSLENCSIWLDGIDTASIVVSGTTTTWQDKSGSARNASNAISSEQPSKVAGGWVQFDGNDGLLFSGMGFASTDAHTITLVIDPDAVADDVILGSPSGTFVQIRPSATILYGNNSFAYQYTTAPQVMQIVYSGTLATPHAVFVNNVQVATDTELSARTLSMLGQYTTNPSTFGFTGKVHALTVHQKALNETERTQLFEFLNTRHGL